jgi:hypothetical protein
MSNTNYNTTRILVFLGLLLMSLGFCPTPRCTFQHSTRQNPQEQQQRESSSFPSSLSSSHLMASSRRISRAEEALMRIDQMNLHIARRKKEKRRSEAEYAEMLAAETRLRRLLEGAAKDRTTTTTATIADTTTTTEIVEIKTEGILPLLQALYFPWRGMLKEIFNK